MLFDIGFGSLELPFEVIRALLLTFLFVWLVQQGRTRAVLSRNGWSYIVWGFACILCSSLVDLTEAVLESADGELSDFWEEMQSTTRGVLVIIGLGLVAGGFIRFIPTVWKLEAEIGERCRAEASLREALAESARLHAEKIALQGQMFQNQKMEALGRVAGGISHDFNNMLNVIRGFGELLIESLDEGDHRRPHALKVVETSRRAQGIVDQILAFARPKSSSRERVDVSVLIYETVQMLSATLPETVSIEFADTGGRPIVEANPVQISQILMNLCVNARDAIGKEPGRIRITSDATAVWNDQGAVPFQTEACGGSRTHLTMSATTPGTPCVRIAVEDTGSGIERAVLERVFEPFFTTKSVDKGTGLGLSVVQGLVSSHGGTIVLESEIGRGTTFSIFLPLAIGVEALVGDRSDFVSDDGGLIDLAA